MLPWNKDHNLCTRNVVISSQWRGHGRLSMSLTGSTKALVTDGSFTTVTIQFVSRSCGISLLLLRSWLATLTTRLYAGWDGGRKWSLCNSRCCNRTKQGVNCMDKCTRFYRIRTVKSEEQSSLKPGQIRCCFSCKSVSVKRDRMMCTVITLSGVYLATLYMVV